VGSYGGFSSIFSRAPNAVYGRACRPSQLYLTLPSEAPLEQDGPVRALVRDAMRQLASLCGSALDMRQRASGLRVELLGQHEIVPDRHGKLPSGAARTMVSTDGAATLAGYSNQVVNRNRQAQAKQTRQAEQEAIQVRLSAAPSPTAATGWTCRKPLQPGARP
jgi:hypothetical protein